MVLPKKGIVDKLTCDKSDMLEVKTMEYFWNN